MFLKPRIEVWKDVWKEIRHGKEAKIVSAFYAVALATYKCIGWLAPDVVAHSQKTPAIAALLSWQAWVVLALLLALLLTLEGAYRVVAKRNKTHSATAGELRRKIEELTETKVSFDISTAIRNSTVLLTDAGDTEDWRDALAFVLDAKLFVRFYNEDSEGVRISGLRLSIINDVTGKEWPLTFHLIAPNFRKPDAHENEYFQGFVVRGKELTGYFWFQFCLDVPKDCALAVDKNCYLRVSMDAGKQDTYFVDLIVPWKGARVREVDVQNRNSDAQINFL